jgi:hypothetical protein
VPKMNVNASDPSKIQISAPAFYIIIVFMKVGFQLLEVMLPVIFGDDRWRWAALAAWAPRVEGRAHDLSLYLSRFLPPSSRKSIERRTRRREYRWLCNKQADALTMNLRQALTCSLLVFCIICCFGRGERSPYEIMGVSRNASQDDIRRQVSHAHRA